MLRSNKSSAVTTMLDQTIAGYLQLFSFPLESLGFLLAAIEIIAPARARRLATIVIDQSRTMSSIIQFMMKTAQGWAETNRGYLLALLLALVLGFVFAFLWDGAWGVVAFSVVLLASTGVFVMLSLLTYQLVRLSFQFASRLSSGKVLGALGLILAACGLSLEGYQYVTQAVLDPVQLAPLNQIVRLQTSFASAAASVGVIYFYLVTLIAAVTVLAVKPLRNDE